MGLYHLYYIISTQCKLTTKRFGLGIITNQYGIPLFAKAYSGNASDKETIIEAMKKLQENITFPDNVYYIADSALYSDSSFKDREKTITIDCIVNILTGKWSI